MDPADIRAYVNRDWDLIAWTKLEYAISLAPADKLRIADELRRHAQAVRPDWPDAQALDEDLAAHIRVSQALRACRI